MFRTVDCGALRASDVNKEVVLSGWISKIRDKGFVLWIDLRDRYGITQLVLDEERTDSALLEKARDWCSRSFSERVNGFKYGKASAIYH